MLRRVVYTTNAIESLNYQLRKITKNRGHFPSEEAAVKLLWLAICNIEDKRAAQRLTDAGKPPNKRTGHTRLIQGHTTTNWKQALAQLTTDLPRPESPPTSNPHNTEKLTGSPCGQCCRPGVDRLRKSPRLSLLPAHADRKRACG